MADKPKKGFPCKFCEKRVKWPKNYEKGDPPVNLDGSPHTCKGGPGGGGKSSSKKHDDADKDEYDQEEEEEESEDEDEDEDGVKEVLVAMLQDQKAFHKAVMSALYGKPADKEKKKPAVDGLIKTLTRMGADIHDSEIVITTKETLKSKHPTSTLVPNDDSHKIVPTKGNNKGDEVSSDDDPDDPYANISESQPEEDEEEQPAPSPKSKKEKGK